MCCHPPERTDDRVYWCAEKWTAVPLRFGVVSRPQQDRVPVCNGSEAIVLMGLLQLRFERDSSTIRARHATTRYEVFRALAYEIDSNTPRESVVGVSCI